MKDSLVVIEVFFHSGALPGPLHLFNFWRCWVKFTQVILVGPWQRNGRNGSIIFLLIQFYFILSYI